MLTLSLSLLLLPAGAWDGPNDRPKLAVLGLAHDDDVPAELATKLSTAVRFELLGQAEFETLSGDELYAVVDPLGPSEAPRCADEACAADLAQRTGASLLAWGRLRVDGTPTLELFLYDATVGRTVSHERAEGSVALTPGGAGELGRALLLDARGRAGLGPSASLRSGWLASGVTVFAGSSLLAAASVGTAAFSAFVFLNGYNDVGTRETARWVNAGATVTGVASLVGMAAGAGLGAVAFVVEE